MESYVFDQNSKTPGPLLVYSNERDFDTTNKIRFVEEFEIVKNGFSRFFSQSIVEVTVRLIPY